MIGLLDREIKENSRKELSFFVYFFQGRQSLSKSVYFVSSKVTKKTFSCKGEFDS